MKVTSVRIRVPEEASDKLVAYATVEIDGCLVLSHLRVLVNQQGRRCVEMPSRLGATGHYVDVAYPITEELRMHLRSSVLQEVAKCLPE